MQCIENVKGRNRRGGKLSLPFFLEVCLHFFFVYIDSNRSDIKTKTTLTFFFKYSKLFNFQEIFFFFKFVT